MISSSEEVFYKLSPPSSSGEYELLMVSTTSTYINQHLWEKTVVTDTLGVFASKNSALLTAKGMGILSELFTYGEDL